MKYFILCSFLIKSQNSHINPTVRIILMPFITHETLAI